MTAFPLLSRFRVGGFALVAVQVNEAAPEVGEMVVVTAVLTYGALHSLEEHYDPSGAGFRSRALDGIVLAVASGSDRHWHYGPRQLLATADLAGRT